MSKKFNGISIGTRCFFSASLDVPGISFSNFTDVLQTLTIPNLSRSEVNTETLNDPINKLFHMVGLGVPRPDDTISIGLIDTEYLPIFETDFYVWLNQIHKLDEWPSRGTLTVVLYDNQLNPGTVTYTMEECLPKQIGFPDLNQAMSDNIVRSVTLDCNRVDVKIGGGGSGGSRASATKNSSNTSNSTRIKNDPGARAIGNAKAASRFVGNRTS